MNSGGHSGRRLLAQASAATLCLSFMVGCAVHETPIAKKSAPASEAASAAVDASIDSGVAPRGAGMPNVPIHRADAGTKSNVDAMAASPQRDSGTNNPPAVPVGALDAGGRDAGVPQSDAGSSLAGATPLPIHRYSFSGSGTSVPDEQGGKAAQIKGNAKLDGQDVVDFDGTGDGLVELPDDTFAELSDFSVLVWLYVSSDACWQRAFDLSYAQQVTSSSGPGPGMMVAQTELTSLYLTPYGCPDALPTLGYVTGTSRYHLVGKQALPQDEPLLLGLTYDLRNQTLRLIVDGVVESEQRVLLDLHSLHRATAWLGRSPMPGDPVLEGSISELRVYASALAPDILMQVYERGPDTL